VTGRRVNKVAARNVIKLQISIEDSPAVMPQAGVNGATTE